MFNPTQDKLRLLDQIRMERDFLLRSLAGLTPDVMERPATLGEWSVKGVVAHTEFWVRLYLDAMDAEARGEKPDPLPWGLSDPVIEAMNAADYAQTVSRPLAAVLGDFLATYDRLLAHVIAQPDETLFVPGYHAWMGRDTIAHLVFAIAVEHCLEHAAQIRRWKSESTVGNSQ